MRLLRYPGVPLLASLLVVSLGCPAPQVIDDDDDPATTAPATTTTTTPSDDTTSAGMTTNVPPETTTGVDSGTDTEADSSSGGGGGGQACGDGIIQGTEQCDCGGEPCSPAGLGGNICAGLVNPQFPNRVYTGGILDCSPASCQFVFAQCSFCGDMVLNGNEICELGDTGPSCQALGMGTSTAPLDCGNNCQWDTTCCPMPPPKECL